MMKPSTLLLLLSLLIFTDTSSAQKQDELQLTTEEETAYWGFLSERLFDLTEPFNENDFYPAWFQTDVKVYANHINPYNASIQNAIKAIQPYIPYSISQTTSKDDANIIINFAIADRSSLRIQKLPTNGSNNGNLIEKVNVEIILRDSLKVHPPLYRDKLFQFLLVRSLVNSKFISGDWKKGHYVTKQNVKGAIFDRKGNSGGYYLKKILQTNYTKADKFILKKVYSENFIEQYKNYIKREKSLLFNLKYFYHGKMSYFGTVASFLLCFVLLVLASKFVLLRQYKSRLFTYLITGITLASIPLFSLWLNHLLTQVGIDRNFNRHFGGGWSLFWLQLILLYGVAILTALVLFLLEKLFIRKSFSLFKTIVIKSMFTFFAFVPTVIIVGQIIMGNTIERFDDIAWLLFTGMLIGLVRGSFLYLRGKSAAMLREKDVELSKLRERKAQAEVASLHARINPHFLYNALNSIAALVHSNPEKTEQMALSLSDLFRHNINRKNEDSTSIKDEVDAVRAYLEIEQIRFGDRLQFTINVDSGLEQEEIPRNIIQPLVENAIKHGVSTLEGEGTIKVLIMADVDGVVISVSDNGAAFPEGLISGYGLQSIHDILTYTYGDEASLNWENEPKKRIWVKFPLKK